MKSCPVLLLLASLLAAADPLTTQAESNGLLATMLAGPLKGKERVVLAQRAQDRDGHWYANFGYHCHNADRYVYGPGGGKLLILDLRTGEETVLLEDLEGGVRDPVVDYDGKTILFSYRPGGTHDYHLYTIQADGTGLTQVTDGDFDDYEPCFLPDGGIMFCSSRCYRWVPCWYTQVGIMYRCERDGSRMRQISFGVEHENHPWVLPDGRVLYTRWEYVDRHTNGFHHLWTVNPDGTGQMVYYGNLAFGRLMIDAKPIPGSNKIAAIVGPGHGKSEHQGDILVIDPDRGPSNAKPFGRQLNADAEYQINRHTVPKPTGSGLMDWRDVWPLSENCFLACNQSGLYVLNRFGDFECVYQCPPEIEYDAGGRKRKHPLWVHEPRILESRSREQVIPLRVDESKRTGTMVLADVYRGRNMAGVKRGEIKSLLVLEELPKPVSYNWAPSPFRARHPGDTGSLIIHRVLGTAPVEEDGSAHFEVPANRAIFFVALDEEHIAVKRMQSFVSVMAGETVSCVGCHEPRVQAPHEQKRPQLSALKRPASKLKPVPGVKSSGLIDFPRDIQPVLDEHCVRCHSVKTPSGGIRLDGARNPYWTFGYSSLIEHRQLGMSGAYYQNNIHGNAAPRSMGSPVSKLLDKVRGAHHKVKVSDTEARLLATWVDTSACFAGTYASLVLAEPDYPRVDRMKGTVLHRKCASCHFPKKLGRNMWPFRKHSWIDISRIENSHLLRAPLARTAGGLELCRKQPARSSGKLVTEPSDEPAVVFEGTDDPDYAELVNILKSAVGGSARRPPLTLPAYWQPGFVPHESYVRELKRCGALEQTWEPGDDVDWFEVEDRYFSLFHTEAEKRGE